MTYERLQSERLEYRPFVESDYDDLKAILTDPEVCAYLPGVTAYSEEQVRKLLAFLIRSFDPKRNQFIYAITKQNESRVIGYCGCAYVKEYDCNEIKYFFHRDEFGNGFASEAALRMKQLAEEMGIKHLVGLADIGNIASQRVLEKIGYVYQDTIPLWGATMKYYTMDL